MGEVLTPVSELTLELYSRPDPCPGWNLPLILWQLDTTLDLWSNCTYYPYDPHCTLNCTSLLFLFSFFIGENVDYNWVNIGFVHVFLCLQLKVSSICAEDIYTYTVCVLAIYLWALSQQSKIVWIYAEEKTLYRGSFLRFCLVFYYIIYF